MAQSVTPKNIRETKRYTKEYRNFMGVDFSTDQTQISPARSPYALNLIPDVAGFPEKRPGWKTERDYGARIHGIHWCVLSDGVSRLLVHAGSRLFVHPEGEEAPAELCSTMAEAGSFSFVHRGTLYLLDGKTYGAVSVKDGAVQYSPVTERDCFVPTTTIGMKADGSGTAFESFNLLTRWRKNSMIGDGESVTFQLDTKDLDPDAEVSAVVEGEEKLENTDFTVDRAAGTITFHTAPPVYAGGSGIDNITVTFAKTVEGAAEKISKCRFGMVYGYGGANRYFVSGNPDEKNVDWHSGLDDPTYFPDLGYTKIGADGSAIMGYLRQYENMVIVKEDNEQDAEIYLRSAQLDIDGNVIFPVQQGVKGVGAIAAGSFASLRDDPLFLAREGVFSMASASVTQQRAVQARSTFINGRLTKEPGIENAVAAVWNGWYLLCVNAHCYVADSRQRTAQGESWGYEWYYWNNIPAVCMREVAGKLWFGTAEGKLCAFREESGMDRYSDDGQPIEAVWTTILDDFGTFGKRKTMIKKGCAVMIKPYTRSSVEVWAATEKLWEWKIREGTMDIFSFADIDFGRFTFNTRDTPQVIPFNRKIKKFITLQLIFRNAELNEGFGVFGAEVSYVLGNYVK